MKEIDIETERLILRKYTMDDVSSCYQNYGNDSQLGNFLPMYPISNMEVMSALISDYIRAYEKDALIWVIVLRETKACIGNITIDIPYPMLKTAELGYAIGSEYWHRGYASETVTEVLDYMFRQEKIHLVEAKYNVNNSASGKVLKRLGFKKDGVLRDRRIDRETGEWNDLVVCSITEYEFLDKV